MSEEAKCKHCGKSKEEHSQRGICGGILSSCYSPAEPSPAPPAEREWLVVDSMPEAMKILADKLKQAEAALTAAREERDIKEESAIALAEAGSQWAAKYRTAIEERDRARDAFNALDRFRRGDYKSWQESGGPDECGHGYAKGINCPGCDAIKVSDYVALKPVSDCQPEGETR